MFESKDHLLTLGKIKFYESFGTSQGQI